MQSEVFQNLRRQHFGEIVLGAISFDSVAAELRSQNLVLLLID
jgi:hypothetical protein